MTVRSRSFIRANVLPGGTAAATVPVGQVWLIRELAFVNPSVVAVSVDLVVGGILVERVTVAGGATELQQRYHVAAAGISLVVSHNSATATIAASVQGAVLTP